MTRVDTSSPFLASASAAAARSRLSDHSRQSVGGHRPRRGPISQGDAVPQVMDADRMSPRADAHRARDPRAQPRRRRARARRHPHARRAARAPARAQRCSEINGDDVPTGALDITLYRDDLMRHAGRAAAGRPPDRDPVLDRRPARSCWSTTCSTPAGRFARRSTR